MTTTQDAQIMLALESTYGTGVTVTRGYEFTDESLDYDPQRKQGQSLRVGARVARSARRTTPTLQTNGDFTVEAISKGMGLLWQLALGSYTSTLVSGSTYQGLAVLGDTPPSATVQKGVVQAGLSSVDALTFVGMMVDSWTLNFPNADIANLALTWDGRNVGTAAGLAAWAGPALSANLFHFANLGIYTGTLTAATNTALASGATQLANVRGGSITCNNNLQKDRFNAGGAGLKSKPLVGLREITCSLDMEYDSTTMRDAFLNDTPMALVATMQAGALSTGLETLQVVLGCIKPDAELPKTNGENLVVQGMKFTGLDDGTNPVVQVVTRTSDNAA